jgi:hypothetical protein
MAAGDVEQQLVAGLDGDPGFRRPGWCRDLGNIDGRKGGTDRRPTPERLLRVHRLKAAGRQSAEARNARQRDDEAASPILFKPRH